MENNLLNPVTYIRHNGEDGLRQQLDQIELSELVKMCKRYTPDANRVIYKKDKEKIINYIIQRALALSKSGQCFRNVKSDIKELSDLI